MLCTVSNESIYLILTLSLNWDGSVSFFATPLTAHKWYLFAATRTLSHLSLFIYLPVKSLSLSIYLPSNLIRSSSSNPSIAPFLFMCNVIFISYPLSYISVFSCFSSCHTKSYHITPSYLKSSHIISSHLISSHITPYHVLSITYAYRQC
jgi:hypothetical protein